MGNFKDLSGSKFSNNNLGLHPVSELLEEMKGAEGGKRKSALCDVTSCTLSLSRVFDHTQRQVSLLGRSSTPEPSRDWQRCEAASVQCEIKTKKEAWEC